MHNKSVDSYLLHLHQIWSSSRRSVHELVDGSLDGLDEAGKLFVLIGSDAGSNHGSGHTAGPAESSLGLNKDVGDVLPYHMNACTEALKMKCTHLLFT